MSKFRTGNGADWLDLLATRLGRYQRKQVEMLADPAALAAWLREHGMEPVTEVTAADVEAVRSLREALHRAATATVHGERPAAEDVRLVQEALASDRPLEVRSGDAGLELTQPADVSVALAWLARQAAVDLTGPTRERLHACGDETCSGIFVDHTGRRRWCSDERCGVRSRVRAHRARARDQTATSM
ncbi:CGNR zinc finger domain-containing protein [Paractinoplanes globisporus]|uniref:CGNR zinc finger domain-containing protein n=1 Tax=Paractinoplanes globisporus TaxID=113565 RepID=A0ABW6W3W6_9ACTN|nr:ABATE domain-containing protein [Actinoplanes globisporus]